MQTFPEHEVVMKIEDGDWLMPEILIPRHSESELQGKPTGSIVNIKFWIK